MVAAREASVCGAMEITGTLCETQISSGLLARKFRTSVCACMLMRTDSAEVMHPLGAMSTDGDFAQICLLLTCMQDNRSG